MRSLGFAFAALGVLVVLVAFGMDTAPEGTHSFPPAFNNASENDTSSIQTRPRPPVQIEVMDVVQLLGANVRHHRKLKGMSQEQLALEAGMERSYVSDLERGTRNPSVQALGRLADALKVEPAALLERR